MALDDIRFFTGMEPVVHVADPKSIPGMLEPTAKNEESEFEGLDEALADIEDNDVDVSREQKKPEEEASVLEGATQAPVVKMVNLIIMDAIR